MSSENAPTGTPVECLVGRFVACCTVAGELHLFSSKEDFTSFARSNSSCMGLVMAWINDVVVHDDDTSLQVVDMLRRYRTEVPPGHQPHMMAHKVDEILEKLHAR